MLSKSTQKWWVLFSVGLMMMLINLDVTIVNLAIPTINSYFHNSFNETSWVITSYLIAGAISFVIGGRLADKFGKHKVFFIGVLTFGFSSLFAGLTTNFWVLVVMRLIQGIGFGLLFSLSIQIITSYFPLEKRGLALGICLTISGASQAIGPTVGGFVITYVNWHWVFLLNVPIAIISFVIAKIVCDKDSAVMTDVRFDFKSSILFIFSTTLFMLGVNYLNLKHLFDWPILVLILGVFSIAYFCHHAKGRRHAIIDFNLFSNKPYNVTLIIRAIHMFGWACMMFCIPIYLESVLRFSPLKSGLIMLMLTSLFALTSPFVGKVLDRIGALKPLMLSLIIALASFILLFIQFIHPNTIVFFLSLVLFGLSTGLMIPSSIFATMNSLSHEHANSGMGLFFTVLFIGSSIGVKLSAALISYHAQATIGLGCVVIINIILLLISITIYQRYLKSPVLCDKIQPIIPN